MTLVLCELSTNFAIYILSKSNVSVIILYTVISSIHENPREYFPLHFKLRSCKIRKMLILLVRDISNIKCKTCQSDEG